MQHNLRIDAYDNVHLTGWMFAFDGPFSLFPSDDAREWFKKHDHPTSHIFSQTRGGWCGHRKADGSFLFRGCKLDFTVPFKDDLTADDIFLEYLREIAGVKNFARDLIASFHQQWEKMDLPVTSTAAKAATRRNNEALGLSPDDLTARVKAAIANPIPARPIDEMVRDAKETVRMQEQARKKTEDFRASIGAKGDFAATICPDEPGMTRIEFFLVMGGNLLSTTRPPPPLAEWALYDNIIIRYNAVKP